MGQLVNWLRRIGGTACIGAILLLSLLPAQEMARTGAPKGVEHFLAYCGTAALLSLGLSRREVLIRAALLCALSVLMEGLQAFSPGRSPKLSDVVASSLGGLAGAMLGLAINAVMARRSTSA